MVKRLELGAQMLQSKALMESLGKRHVAFERQQTYKLEDINFSRIWQACSDLIKSHFFGFVGSLIRA